MRTATLILDLASAMLAVGGAAQAQGIFRAAEQGAARGNAVARPIGGLVGAGVGGVNGALGIHPRYRRVHALRGYHGYRHRHCYRHRHHYHCR